MEAGCVEDSVSEEVGKLEVDVTSDKVIDSVSVTISIVDFSRILGVIGCSGDKAVGTVKSEYSVVVDVIERVVCTVSGEEVPVVVAGNGVKLEVVLSETDA